MHERTLLEASRVLALAGWTHEEITSVLALPPERPDGPSEPVPQPGTSELEELLPQLAASTRQADVESLERRIVEAQVELTELQASIDIAERRYLVALGPVLRRIQHARAKLLQTLARNDGSFAQQAEQAAAEAAELDAERVAPPRPPLSDELRALFRRVARASHPDLASSDEDRRRRHQLMVAANAAMDARDPRALERLIAESAPLASAHRPKTEADIALLRRRLAFIGTELAALRTSDGAQLAQRLAGHDSEAVLDAMRADLTEELRGVLEMIEEHPHL